jgi:hypothetical protein
VKRPQYDFKNLTSASAILILRELQNLQEKLLFSDDSRLEDDDCEYRVLLFTFYAKH